MFHSLKSKRVKTSVRSLRCKVHSLQSHVQAHYLQPTVHSPKFTVNNFLITNLESTHFKNLTFTVLCLKCSAQRLPLAHTVRMLTTNFTLACTSNFYTCIFHLCCDCGFDNLRAWGEGSGALGGHESGSVCPELWMKSASPWRNAFDSSFWISTAFSSVESCFFCCAQWLNLKPSSHDTKTFFWTDGTVPLRKTRVFRWLGRFPMHG